jgi:hypothetical protein
VRVQIYETRRRHETASVNDCAGADGLACDRGDLPVSHSDMGDIIMAAFGVHDPRSEDRKVEGLKGSAGLAGARQQGCDPSAKGEMTSRESRAVRRGHARDLPSSLIGQRPVVEVLSRS